MKKKFTILGALVCAVVLGFAGCDIGEILSNWAKALQEALGLNRTHDIIANGEPVAIPEGTYNFRVNFSSNYTGKSNAYGSQNDVYIYVTSDEATTTAVSENLSAGDEAYQWVLEKLGDYTFTLKNKATGTYMSYEYDTDHIKLVDDEDSAAQMQIWTWTPTAGEEDEEGKTFNAVDILVLVNRDTGVVYNDEDATDIGTYNAYLYPLGDDNLDNVHWWGASTNQRLTSVLAVFPE